MHGRLTIAVVYWLRMKDISKLNLTTVDHKNTGTPVQSHLKVTYFEYIYNQQQKYIASYISSIIIIIVTNPLIFYSVFIKEYIALLWLLTVSQVIPL